MAIDWTWSISKSHQLEKCPKAFEISTLARGFLHENPVRYNLGALVGIAIHQAISEQLDNWAIGKTVSPLAALSRMEQFIDRVWRERNSQIVEVSNGYDPESRILLSIKRAATSRLERFYRILWPQISDCQHFEHEQYHEFRVENENFAVRIDLACRGPEGNLWIVDWKTGGWENELSGRSQLAIYTLWAQSAYQLELDRITPMIVGLETGNITRFQPSAHDLQYVLDIAHADRRKVSEYVDAGEFPTSAEPSKCWGCGCLKQCEEGRLCVGLE